MEAIIIVTWAYTVNFGRFDLDFGQDGGSDKSESDSTGALWSGKVNPGEYLV